MSSQHKKLDVVDLTLSDDDGPTRSSEKPRRSTQIGLGASRIQSSKHGRPSLNKDNKGASSTRNAISDLGKQAEASTKGSGSKPRHANGGEHRQHDKEARQEIRRPAHARLSDSLTASSDRRGAQSSSQDLKPARTTPLKTPFDRAPRPYAQSSAQNPPEKGPVAQTPSKMNEKDSRKHALDSDASHRDGMPAKRSKFAASSENSNKKTAERSASLIERARTTIPAVQNARPTAQKTRSAAETIDLTSPPSSRTQTPHNRSETRETPTGSSRKSAGPSVGSPGTISSKSNRKSIDRISESVLASEKGNVAKESANGHTRPSSSLPARPKSPTNKSHIAPHERVSASHISSPKNPFESRQSKRMGTAKDQAVDKIAKDRSSGAPMHFAQKPRPSLVPFSSSSVDLGSGFASDPPSSKQTATLAAPIEGRTRSTATAPDPGSPSKLAQGDSKKAAGANLSPSNAFGVENQLPKTRATQRDKTDAVTSIEDHISSSEQRRGGSLERISAPTADGAPRTPVQEAAHTKSSDVGAPVTPSSPPQPAASHAPDNDLSLAQEADLQLRTEASGETCSGLAKTSPAFAVPTFAASAMKKSIYGNLPLTSQVEKVLGKYLEEMRGDNEYWASTFLQRARLTKDDVRTRNESMHPVSFAAMKPIKLSPQQKKSVLGGNEQQWKVEKIGPNGKPLGVTPLTTRYTEFHTETKDVPNYAHYVSIKRNILAPNVTNLHSWPYFGDDFELAQAGNLHEEYNLDIDLREEKLLLLLQAQKYEPYVESTLQDLECSWAEVLHCLIEEQARQEDSWKAKELTQKQQVDEERRRKIENFSAKSARSKAILAALPPATPEKRERIEGLCENFRRMAKFSVWHVARRSEEANPRPQAEDTKDILADLTCRVCLRVSCSYHGQLNERPEDDSDLDGSSTKDKTLATDIVNPSRANYRTRVAFPPTLPEPSVSSHDPRLQTQKKSSQYWRSPQLWKNLDKLEPFYPCHHPGTSCEDAKCSCYNECRPCEKTCACSVQCGRRFQGCSCAKKGSKCYNDSDCACHYNGRECDPDLCGTCGVCEVVDPTSRYNDAVLVGRCRNASIQRSVSKHTLLGDSGVHGLGLWACEDVREHEFVGEYKGEIITKEEADRRGAVYEHQKLSYLFSLNASQEIDSTYFGNKIRFINHASSQKANLYPRIIMVNAVHRIALYANHSIKSGEELFFDYGPKFPDEQLGGKKSKSEKSAPHVRNANLIQGFKDVEESEDAVGNLRTKAINRLAIDKGRAKGKKGGTRARGGTSSGRTPQHANQADESPSDNFADPGQRLQTFNISDEAPLHDPMEMDDDDDYHDDPEEHGSSEIAGESDEE